MSWKATAIEAPIWLAGKLVKSYDRIPEAPQSIFVLRNNDIGDLLVTSPLFQALKEIYPGARLTVAVGPWNKDTLLNNPYVDEVLVVDAPWNNRTCYGKSIGQVYAGALRYIFQSSQVRDLQKRHFTIGIDVLGSHLGSVLLLRLGIPFRLGVKGLIGGGGASACQLTIPYDYHQHVSRHNLRFAEILGARSLPPARPQIYLSDDERERGERKWRTRSDANSSGAARVVIAPGSGHPNKSWGADNFVALARELAQTRSVDILVLGGAADANIGEAIASAISGAVSACGKLSLRESFAAIAACDLVFCNGSMVMHAAAAFTKPEVVLLGPEWLSGNVTAWESAQQHQQQWGYPGTCVSLGPTQLDRRLTTVREAINAGMELLRQSSVPNALSNTKE